ncbi:hypothetical protein NXX40_05380 [Parabacteroides distasonis]|nr:hypothetical protein [Parabacteroides distasonis]
MKLFSNIISFVFHPLLMVTYGIVLALMFTFLAIYPLPVKLLIAGGTFISTAIVPGLFIFLLVKNGAAGDIELSDRKERVVPYLIFITSILVCIFFLYKMLMPFWLLAMLIGACVALVIALCVNFAWKISAHAIGIGGLLGRYYGSGAYPYDKSLPGFYSRVDRGRFIRYLAHLFKKTYTNAGICGVLSRDLYVPL